MDNQLDQNFTPLNLSQLKQGKSKINSLLLIFSSLIFTLSVAFSYLQMSSNKLTTNSQAADKTASTDVLIEDNLYIRKQTAIEWQKIIDNSPQNPNQVTATASLKGKIIFIQNNTTNDYSEITFTWTGEKAVEPNTKITGYYVYFGPNNTEIPYPKKDYLTSVTPQYIGQLVNSNTFTATNLTKGTTYYLYVVAVSNSSNKKQKFGIERLGGFKTLPAKKLFTYIYQ